MLFKLEIPNSKSIGDLVQAVSQLKPGQYSCEITEIRKKASNKQRGYYHGIVCLAIAVHLGWEKEDVHEYIKNTYNAKEVVNPRTGEIIIIPGSTSGMDTKEYSELTDKVKIYWLQDMGLEVPDPEDVTDEYVYQLKKQYENRFLT